jgi:hypothetical protein
VPGANEYRNITVSVSSHQVDEADRLASILQAAGLLKANRSLIVREALARMLEELSLKNSEEVFRYFVESLAKGVRDEVNRPSGS